MLRARSKARLCGIVMRHLEQVGEDTELFRQPFNTIPWLNLHLPLGSLSCFHSFTPPNVTVFALILCMLP